MAKSENGKRSGRAESGDEALESEPALISVIFSFLLRLGEVKYHWSKSGSGAKTVNQTYKERSDRVCSLPRVQHGARKPVECVYF